MKFGEVPLDQAEGAILAHTAQLPGRAIKKGQVLTRADVATLREAGLDSVVALRLEAGDVGENDAAAEIAAACQGDNLKLGRAFTGRCNLTATKAGVLVVDATRVNALNRVDESTTLATLRPFDNVRKGQLAATVKIIPLAAPRAAVDACIAIAGKDGPIVRIAPYRPQRIALVQTLLPGLKPGVVEKTVTTTRARLADYANALDADIRCGHDEEALAAELAALRDTGCDIALVLGASAIIDRRDVIPAAVRRAGGTVEHFGMPVDPGNLMLLARIGRMRVLGLPGSARSPRLHGFDWVLQRMIAGIEVSGDDLMGMGVGGLLKEIPSRPMPREVPPDTSPDIRAPRIAAIVLAAGQSRRMGAVNKLLAEIDGTPMVTRVVDTVIASRAEPVVVVTGHEAARVRGALNGRDVRFVHNPDYAAGLSTSLKRALQELPGDVDGAVVCLGDMPSVAAHHIDRLIEAFAPGENRGICVPVSRGKRGNPVLWDRAYFDEMAELAGDVGARHLIGSHAEAVCEVAIEDDGILLDLDTPEALAAHLANRDTGKV